MSITRFLFACIAIAVTARVSQASNIIVNGGFNGISPWVDLSVSPGTVTNADFGGLTAPSVSVNSGTVGAGGRAVLHQDVAMTDSTRVRELAFWSRQVSANPPHLTIYYADGGSTSIAASGAGLNWVRNAATLPLGRTISYVQIEAIDSPAGPSSGQIENVSIELNPNVVVNAGFENGAASWQNLSDPQAIAFVGTLSWGYPGHVATVFGQGVDPPFRFARFRQDLPHIHSEQVVEFSAWGTSSSTLYPVSVYLNYTSGAPTQLSFVGPSWTPHAAAVSGGRILAYVEIVAGGSPTGGANGSVDDIEIEVALPRGDVNCDAAVNNFDIDAFVLALTNPGAYATAYPECAVVLADVNEDGAVNNFDVDTFVELLVG